MQAATALRPTKPAYKPSVKLVNIRTGAYRVLSSDGITLYDVNVAAVTCTCKAGQNDFRSCKALPYCKHVAAAKVVAKAIHDSRKPVAVVAPVAAPRPVDQACGKCGATYWGVKAEGWCSCGTTSVQEPIDLAARRAERPAYTPATPELMEAFGW